MVQAGAMMDMILIAGTDQNICGVADVLVDDPPQHRFSLDCLNRLVRTCQKDMP